MNIILLAGLAICEIFFAGVILWEFYCLLRWLDRRVFTPLLSKVNDLILRVYAHHMTEEWLFWEGRKHGNGHEPACEATVSTGQGFGERDDPAPGE